MTIALGAAGSALIDTGAVDGIAGWISSAVLAGSDVVEDAEAAGAMPAGAILAGSADVFAASIGGCVAAVVAAAEGCSSATQAAVNEARSKKQTIGNFKNTPRIARELLRKAYPERFLEAGRIFNATQRLEYKALYSVFED